jgi:malate dehydrogenase (oxaloacetate-decarboxylating)(NADP+)
VGFDRPVQILPISARDSDIANMAALAAYNISG